MNFFKSIYFVLIFTSLILAYFQTLRIDAPNYEMKKIRHESIINNSIEYPYKYRILNPFLTEIWIRLFTVIFPVKASFLAGYFIQNLIVYGFMVFSVLLFFSLWFNLDGVMLSGLMFTLLIPLSLTGYDTLGDISTAGFMALSFYLMNTHRIKYLYPLIFIAAFNELQSVLMSFFYFFSSKDNLFSRRAWLRTSGLISVFAFSYLLIYFLRGGEFGVSYVSWYFTKDAIFNLIHRDWIVLWIVMIGPFLPFALKSLRTKPEFLKRSFLYVLPVFYFLAFFFIGRMREIDKALTIFIILIPLALMTIAPSMRKVVYSDGVSS